MDFLKKYKITLIVLTVGIIALIAYQILYVNKQVGNPLVSSDAQREGSVVGQEVIALLYNLEAISINTDFFKDPVFRGLFDLEKQVESEEIGKNNPFVPIGGDSGPVGALAEPTQSVNMLYYVTEEYVEDDLFDETEDIVIEESLDDASIDITEDELLIDVDAEVQ